MSATIFDLKFPGVCEVLAGSPFDADKQTAAAMQPGEFKEAFEQKRFRLMALMDLLCGAMVPEWTNVGGETLEGGLRTLVNSLGIEKVKGSFRNKLLVPDEDTLEDALYEVAVTARACAVLDVGSVELERPIPDPSKNPQHLKNSDIYGTFQGQPVRIEVTVLHDKPVGSVDLDLEAILTGAAIDANFQVEMRTFLADEASAIRARKLLEGIHAHHVASGGQNAGIEGVGFVWQSPRYIYRHGASPFQSVQFFRDGDLRGDGSTRYVRYPSSIRPVTPGYLREDFPNPEGVVEWGDTLGTSKQVSLSKRIRDLLEIKLAQCETGIVNIVAFGNPRHMNEAQVRYALFGAPVGVGRLFEDDQGVRRVGEARLYRAPKAPFNPIESLKDPADQEYFTEPFRKMSAVWHLRLGNHGKSETFRNPNALVPAPGELLGLLSGEETAAPAK